MVATRTQTRVLHGNTAGRAGPAVPARPALRHHAPPVTTVHRVRVPYTRARTGGTKYRVRVL